MRILKAFLIVVLVACARGAAAQTFVQGPAQSVVLNFNATQTMSFAVLPTVGNHVFVVASGYHAAGDIAPTITDNQAGNTYASNSYLYSDPVFAFIYSVKVVGSSGTFTVSLDPTGSSNYITWRIIEVSGLATSSHLDQVGSTTATATSGTVTAAGANAQANMFVVAAMATSGSTNPQLISDPPSGYTSIYLFDNGSTGEPAEAAYKIITGAETSAASWTWTDSAKWVGVIATYKAAAGSVTHSFTLLGVGR